MEIVLIRHFPTKGNRQKQYIGRTDEPLDEEAVKVILDEIGDKSALYPSVECVVTSPMLRCRQTAKLLYPDVPAFSWEKLKETDFGDFEGKTYEELKSNKDYQQWLGSGASGKIPNGESKADFMKRCIEGFGEVMTKLIDHHYESAAFVVHGGTIMALMSEFAEESKDFYNWQVKNGKGYQVHIDTGLWKIGKKSFFNIKKL